MNLQLLGFILTTLGEILIGYSVIRVHSQVSKDHKIDSQVLAQIHKERKMATLGIILILIGFVLQLPGKI